MSDVLVVGGGFAGAAAACRLAAAGHRPLLLERAPRLGGRAASFVLPGEEEPIDYGQHVLMRCCTATTGFLARVGTAHAVRFQPALSIPVQSPTASATLRSSPLPGALHLAPSLLRYRHLLPSDRLRAVRAGLALAAGRSRADAPFAAWLAARGQSERAVRLLWDPITIATLNAPSCEVGLHAARRVFRDGFLRPGAADLGLFAAPLGDAFDAARRYVEARGGAVRTSVAARRLLVDHGAVRGVEIATGELLQADAVICAVPPEDLSRLAADLRPLHPTLDASAGLRWAPIVNLHAWYDRDVLAAPFAVAVDTPIQAAFDVTRLHGDAPAGGRTHLVLSQSAAHAWVDRPWSDVADELLGALGGLFPRARDARCLRTLVIRHRRATFVPSAGSDALRPQAKTPVHGVYLAGDWTSTGWPSTIEGAIRSGLVAAAHAEGQLGALSP